MNFNETNHILQKSLTCTNCCNQKTATILICSTILYSYNNFIRTIHFWYSYETCFKSFMGPKCISLHYNVHASTTGNKICCFAATPSACWRALIWRTVINLKKITCTVRADLKVHFVHRKSDDRTRIRLDKPKAFHVSQVRNWIYGTGYCFSCCCACTK